MRVSKYGIISGPYWARIQENTENNSLFGRFSCSDGFDMKSIIICCLGRDLEVSRIKGAVSGLRPFLANEGSLKMIKKSFLFHVKSSFRSQDI